MISHPALDEPLVAEKLGLVARSLSLGRRGLPLRLGVVDPRSRLALSFFLLLPAWGLLGGATVTPAAPKWNNNFMLYMR